MRIAFLWKWWSGKSTLSTSFASYLHQSNQKTVFVDADINMNWLQILWFNPAWFPFLADKKNEIMDYTFSNRNDIDKKYYLWVTPASQKSNFYHLNDENMKNLSQKNIEWLPMMWIWWYSSEEIGFNCYHGKSDGYICFLNHLIDINDEYLVIDSVTWIDNTSSPLAYSYNLNVIVVEPTHKSIGVCRDFITALNKNNIEANICVVWNKINDKDDEKFIRENIWDLEYIWWVKYLDSMVDFDQWSQQWFFDFVNQNIQLYKKIIDFSHKTSFDKNKYYQDMYKYYSLVCDSYYNKYFWMNIKNKINKNLDFNTIYNNELSKN